MRLRSPGYVPIRAGSAIERVLVEYLAATFLLIEVLTGRRQAEGTPSRREDARKFVQRLWGPSPDLAARYEHRQLLHAQLLGAFFVGGLVSAALIGVGGGLEVPALAVLGRTGLLLSCVPLGAHGPVAVRTMFMEWDARAWASAGRPLDWSPHRWSQLRSGDLLWAAALIVFWGWFFFMLTRGLA